MANNNNSTGLNLRSILEKDKLNGSNFLDWFRNLRIVLKADNKLNVIEVPYPEEPAQELQELPGTSITNTSKMM